MKTILVVDDFASVRLYHANVLRQLGHSVIAASDGMEALEYMRRQHVDLVLLDVLMPKMDGCEFLERARAMPGYATVPVLVITSEGTREHEERFARAGANGFLKKPTLPAAMMAALQQFLG
jgi:two-component system chemotaxis response regulator CheY